MLCLHPEKKSTFGCFFYTYIVKDTLNLKVFYTHSSHFCLLCMNTDFQRIYFMTESRTTFCSTLSVDLGASCTGTFLINHQNTIPTFEDCRAMTLIMPRNGAQMSYSVQQRRAARHRLRVSSLYTFSYM